MADKIGVAHLEPFGNISLPVEVQQRIWELCYDIASHAQTLNNPMRRVFFQRANDVAILFEGVSNADLPRGLQSAFKWKLETLDGELPPRGADEAMPSIQPLT
jgi:hypothetical protein